MPKVLDIYNFIDKMAPFDTAMDFDNVGILVGDASINVEKCLVALDITKDVINEAKQVGANLIISHHPVIFNPIKNLKSNSIPYILAKENITAICAHTNLDIADFGVNTCLSEALGIKNIQALSFYKIKDKHLPMGLIGELDRTYNCDEFAGLVKEKLSCMGVRYTSTDRLIKKVALCSGSGGDLIGEVINKNADAFITGEIKHHEILIAAENDVCVVDAGHFKTEDIVILPLINELAKEFESVEFIRSKSCTDRIKYLV